VSTTSQSAAARNIRPGRSRVSRNAGHGSDEPSAGFVKIRGTARTASETRMGKLVYLMNVSLDGYVETPDHSLDWTVVDEELPPLVQRPLPRDGCVPLRAATV